MIKNTYSLAFLLSSSFRLRIVDCLYQGYSCCEQYSVSVAYLADVKNPVGDDSDEVERDDSEVVERDDSGVVERG